MPAYPGSPRLTVDALLKQPRILSRSLTSLTSKRFVTDKVLAKGTPEMVAGGSATYQKSESIYPDQGQTVPLEVGVRAEFPRAGWTEAIFTAAVHKYGLEVPIAFESVRRNQMDQMARAQKKLANSVTKFVDSLMMSLLLTDSDMLTDTSADWSTSGTDIIADLATFRKQIYDLDEGYEPDTMLLNPAQELDLLMDADIRSVLPRETSNSAVQTGNAPLILGFRQMLVSPVVTAGTVFLLESKIIGTVADEEPDGREGYASTPAGAGEFASIFVKTYEETKRDEWVVRAARFPAMWLAEPKAAVRVTGC